MQTLQESSKHRPLWGNPYEKYTKELENGITTIEETETSWAASMLKALTCLTHLSGEEEIRQTLQNSEWPDLKSIASILGEMLEHETSYPTFGITEGEKHAA